MTRSIFAYLSLVVISAFVAKAELFYRGGVFGKLFSRNFDSPYPNNVDDTWIITVKRGFRVALYFSSFDLEDSFDGTPCSQDFVELKDGHYSTNHTIGRFCGNPVLFKDDAPKLHTRTYRSDRHIMEVRMVSDYSNSLPGLPAPLGFSAHYYAEDRNECSEKRAEAAASDTPEDVGMCEHFCNNHPGGYYCSCRPGYILYSDGYSCHGDCIDQVLPFENGVISTPGFPQSYSRLTDCNWKLQTDAGKTLKLDFDPTFDLESYYTGPKAGTLCPYDWLTITDNSGLRGKFCGPVRPNNGTAIFSSTNWFKLAFHSDKVIEKSGFKVTYATKVVQCELPAPPHHGRLAHIRKSTQGTAENYINFGELIRYECNEGYRLFGSAKVACLKDGSLSDRTPVCEPF